MKEIIEDYANYSYGGDAILIFGGILIIVKLIVNVYDNKVYYAVLQQSHKMAKTEEELNLFVNSLIAIGLAERKRSSFENTIIEGFLFTHASICTESDCPLRLDTIRSIASKGISERELVAVLVQRIYKYALNFRGTEDVIQIGSTSRSWPKNLLNYVYFLVHRVENLHSAALHLAKLKSSKPSLPIRSAIYRIKIELRDLHEERNAKKLFGPKGKECNIDPRLLLEYEAKFAHFKDRMFKIAEKYREIWTQLLSPFPDLNIVEVNLNKAVVENTITQRIKTELQELYPHYEKANKFFAMYLSDVLGQEEMAEEFLSRQKAGNLNEIIFAPNTVTFAVSSAPETLGQIVKASNGVTKLFEYSSNELIGKNINTIMPQVIADKHDDYLVTYLTTGKRKVIDNIVTTVASDKQQFYFTVKALIREYHDLLYGPLFVSLLSAYPPQSLILTDSSGVILGFSKKALRELGSTFSPVFVREYTVKIGYIVPELNWDSEESVETYESLVGERDVTFVLPANLTKVLQSLHGKNAGSKSNKEILAEFEYNDELKKRWKCTIENIKYTGVELKSIFFKPKQYDCVHEPSAGSCKIDKALEFYEDDAFTSGLNQETATPVSNRNAPLIQLPSTPRSEELKGLEEGEKPQDEREHLRNEEEDEDDEMDEGSSQKRKDAAKKVILKELKVLSQINYRRYAPFTLKLALRSALAFEVVCLVVATLFLVYMLVIVSSVGSDYEMILLKRAVHIMDISETISIFLLMNNYWDGKPIVDHSYRDKYDYNLIPNSETSYNFTLWKIKRFYESADELITTQEILNYKALGLFKDSTREALNPSKVTVYTGMDVSIEIDFNSVVNMFANQAIKISRLPLESITIMNPSVAFMLMNSYRNLWELNYDSSQIMQEVAYIQDQGQLVIFVGMVVVGVCGVLFFLAVTPTWRAIIRQSIESIEMLLKIKSKQLRQQIARCGRFMRHVSASENEEHGVEEDYLNASDNEEVFQDKKEEDEGFKRKRHKHRGHKYKGYKMLIVILTSGFGAMVIAVIAYYVGLYLYPYFFNKNIYAHLEELAMLRFEYENRARLHGLMMETMRSVLYEGMLTFTSPKSVVDFIQSMVVQKDSLLAHFNKNKGYFSKSYREYFRTGMQGTICNDDFGTNTDECAVMSNGLLSEGLYATTVYYLTVYQSHIEEITSLSTLSDQVQACREFLNSNAFIDSEVELTKYHYAVLMFLDNLLRKSFLDQQSFGKAIIILMACIAYFINIFVYILPWYIYINFMRKKLVKSKMILCQLPLNMIVHTKQISKRFFRIDSEIMSNLSKTDVHYIV